MELVTEDHIAYIVEIWLTVTYIGCCPQFDRTTTGGIENTKKDREQQDADTRRRNCGAAAPPGGTCIS